jgi:hypothetical protein
VLIVRIPTALVPGGTELGRAVACGVVRQEGTGRPNDPLRHWLAARQEMIRPDGGTEEELQAWNDRRVAEMLAGLEAQSGARLAGEASLSGDEDPTAAVPVADPEPNLHPWRRRSRPCACRIRSIS